MELPSADPYSPIDSRAVDAVLPRPDENLRCRFPLPRKFMKTIPDLAMDILSRSPTPALPLSRLVDAIAEETPERVAGAEQILTEIRSRPDHFRVLDPLIGPWRRATARRGESPPWRPEIWVLGLASGTRASSPVRARTAESLRCLGRTVDENSATDMSHWLLLM